MSNDREHDRHIAERAAFWSSRLPTASLSVRREFVRWLKQSPIHVREILFANALDMELGKFDPERNIDIDALFSRANNVTPLVVEKRGAAANLDSSDTPDATANAGVTTHDSNGEATVAPIAETTPHDWKSWGWVIGIAAAASILALALGWPGIIEGIGIAEQYQTQTGEQKTVPLGDGSVIHINAQSDVRVTYTDQARDIYLGEGQATFDVAHDAARPFRVHVKHAVVQAIGTQFDVNQQMDHTDVAVIQGIVKVTAKSDLANGNTKADSVNVQAGMSIRITADGSISSSDMTVADAQEWRNRRLVFRYQTLAQIATEFNRYNKGLKIRVDGEAVQVKGFSGTFDAGDPEVFLQYLAARDRRLAFDRSTDALVVIRLRSSYAAR